MVIKHGNTKYETIKHQAEEKNKKAKRPKTEDEPKASGSEEDSEIVFSKTKYNQSKDIIIECEKNNYTHLYILRSDGKFWKMFDNSALYYAMIFAPSLDKKDVRIHADVDFKPSYVGFVSIKGIEKFEEFACVKGGVTFDVERSNLPYIRAYKLPKPSSKEEMEGLRKKNQENREKINSIIKVKAKYPDVSNALDKLIARIWIEYNKVSSQPAKNRVIGYLWECACEMRLAYDAMASGEISIDTWIVKNNGYMRRISMMIRIIFNNDIIPIKNVGILTDLFAVYKHLVDGRIGTK